MKFTFKYSGNLSLVDLQFVGDQISAVFEQKSYDIRLIEKAASEMRFEVDGVEHKAYYAKEGRKIWLHMGGRNYLLEKSVGAGAASRTGGGRDDILRAPMPGQVRAVLASQGESVRSGDVLLLLEAMKMEMRIQAPQDGKITRLAVSAGDSVEKDQILVEIEGSAE